MCSFLVPQCFDAISRKAPVAMRPGQYPQGTVGLVGIVEVEPHGEHPLKEFDRGLNGSLRDCFPNAGIMEKSPDGHHTDVVRPSPDRGLWRPRSGPQPRGYSL